MPSLENTETAVARNPLIDVMERHARIEARLDTMANKFWGTMFVIAVMAAGLVTTAIRVWLQLDGGAIRNAPMQEMYLDSTLLVTIEYD